MESRDEDQLALPEVEEEAEVQPKASPPPQRSGRRKSTRRVDAEAMGSVVKVFVVRAKLSYKLPWQRKAPKNSSGSGFTIHPRRILTNAHVVEESTTIMHVLPTSSLLLSPPLHILHACRVRRHGHPKRYVARVVCIGHQCDLALLAVDDDAFWEGYVPLRFGDVPHLQESVTCVGYPTGGDNISVTCGVVSRQELPPDWLP